MLYGILCMYRILYVLLDGICILTVFILTVYSFFFSSLSLLLLFSPNDVISKTQRLLTFLWNLLPFTLDQSDGTIFALDQSRRLILQESADCMALHAFSSTLASRSTMTSLTATGSVGGRKSLAVSSAGQQASASKFQQHHGDKGGTGYNNMSNMHSQFRSSSSQTTFLDRNIVQNLAVTRPGSSLAGGGGPFDQQPQSSSSKLSSVGGRTTATVATGAGGGGGGGHATRRRCRPKTVPASYTSGSGSVKRASFSGTLPDGK